MHIRHFLTVSLLLIPCLCPKLPGLSLYILVILKLEIPRTVKAKTHCGECRKLELPGINFTPIFSGSDCIKGRVTAQRALIPVGWYHTVHVRLRSGVTRTSGLIPTIHGELTRDAPQRSSCFWAGLQLENNSQALSP